MKRTIRCFGFAAFFLLVVGTAFAEIKVTVDYHSVESATKDFKFKNVPVPSKEDAAAKAKLTLVDGEIDPNGADLGALTDGLLPGTEDEPSSNFFFNAGTYSGRFSMDLGRPVEIAQVNSYSWHPSTRGPQVYKLYASDGADPKFNPTPRGDMDPASCGWKLIAVVDTRPREGYGGGQYGVSISDSSGVLGKYQYLLFSCIATEADDDYGNTFYSEIDVIEKK